MWIGSIAERKEKMKITGKTGRYPQNHPHCGNRFMDKLKRKGRNFAKALNFRKNYGIIVGMEQEWEERYINLFKHGETAEKFSIFYRLLRECNETMNLTRIIDEKECYVKHFLDSLSGEKWIKKGADCIEIGSGGGFPSVPLMIARPDLTFLLVESVGKKCTFLKKIVAELNLSAEVVQARAEELAVLKNYREKYDLCCARAVARLNTLAEYCIPFVKVGGDFLAYKGNDAEEISEAENALRILGGKLERAEHISLPDGMGERTLILVKKIKSTPPRYPRGQGKERKAPL